MEHQKLYNFSIITRDGGNTFNITTVEFDIDKITPKRVYIGGRGEFILKSQIDVFDDFFTGWSFSPDVAPFARAVAELSSQKIEDIRKQMAADIAEHERFICMHNRRIEACNAAQDRKDST